MFFSLSLAAQLEKSNRKSKLKRISKKLFYYFFWSGFARVMRKVAVGIYFSVRFITKEKKSRRHSSGSAIVSCLQLFIVYGRILAGLSGLFPPHNKPHQHRSYKTFFCCVLFSVVGLPCCASLIRIFDSLRAFDMKS